jgi:ribosomal protein S18 acetylase RimI-like enzyme
MGGESVIGTVDVSAKPPKRGLPERLFMKNMWVDAGYRRQGVATRLLGKVEEYARGLGIEILALEVLCDNDAAIALYQKHGFALLPSGFGELLMRFRIGRVTFLKELT